MSVGPAYTLQELAQRLGLELDGATDVRIRGLAPLESAGPDQLAFYSNKRFHQALVRTRAGVVILSHADAQHCPAPKLLAANPYAAYARASQLFAPPPQQAAGIHPSAVIAATATIADKVAIGANVVVGESTRIDQGVSIGANCVIGRFCQVGEDSRLHPNVTLYDKVRIGKRVCIHAAVVLGSDGFGFAAEGERHLKIAQLGGVELGDDVEVGAGTCIDRGALEDTHIGNGVKIDNQVQIAHNVRVGENTIICGCSAIAGSSVIGKNCIIAGAVGVINHVSICDNVTVTAMSLVNQSITEPGVYSSGTGLSDSASWRKNIVRFRQLDELWKRLLRLEKNR